MFCAGRAGDAVILVGATVVVAALVYALLDAPVTKSLQHRLKLRAARGLERARPAKT